MEALTNIKDPAPVGNRTPVNKPYVINTIWNEVLLVKVPDNYYQWWRHSVTKESHSYREKHE
jgi:hypothetical protein